MIDEAEVAAYVGREEVRHDVADPERFLRLAALLDRSWSEPDGLPPLGHFVLFRPDERQSRIGADGHPAREPAGMLPAIPLPRRMWAGSRIRFVQPIQSGQALERRSRLTSAKLKSGKSGTMVFCTVQHEIRNVRGGELLVSEEQDIVYREAHSGSELALRPVVEPTFAPELTREVSVDPVMLFRYSALTFNSHRIHYDRDYARREEGYVGLVVHGPYLATLLFDHLEVVARGRRITTFDFRAVSPSLDGDKLVLGAAIEGEKVNLSITGPVGLALSGQATLD